MKIRLPGESELGESLQKSPYSCNQRLHRQKVVSFLKSCGVYTPSVLCKFSFQFLNNTTLMFPVCFREKASDKHSSSVAPELQSSRL